MPCKHENLIDITTAEHDNTKLMCTNCKVVIDDLTPEQIDAYIKKTVERAVSAKYRNRYPNSCPSLEDLAQEIWCRFLKKKHSFEPKRGSLYAFIRTVTESGIYNVYWHDSRQKRQSNYNTLELTEAFGLGIDESGFEEVEHKLLLEDLKKRLGEAPVYFFEYNLGRESTNKNYIREFNLEETEKSRGLHYISFDKAHTKKAITELARQLAPDIREALVIKEPLVP